MIIIILCFLILIGGIFIKLFCDYWSSWDDLAIILIVAGSLFIFMCLIAFPIQKISIESFMAKFKSVEMTLETARSKGEILENTALQLKVIEANSELASHQYYNSTIFGIWIPDKIMDLKSIK